MYKIKQMLQDFGCLNYNWLLQLVLHVFIPFIVSIGNRS